MRARMDNEADSEPTTTATTITTTTTPSPATFGVFTSKKMSETFLRTLECPVCLEIVVPPVFSCTLGHIICSMCRPKLSKCGLCGTAFTTIRNYPIEAMLSLVETECRHNSCSLILMADKLKDHLGVCEYRPIPCHEATLAAECKGTLVNFEDYPRHLMDVHGKSYVDLSPEYPEFVVYDVSTTFHGSQLLGVMNYKGKTFFLRRDYVFQRHYAMCWVTVMAPEQEARKFTFHLKITDPKDHRRSMEWRIRAHSIQLSADLMKISGDCAFIPYDALIPFCERKFIPTPNGQLWEYKWSMVGKVSEYEVPPQSHSINQITSMANVPSAQVNPLNLCSSASSYSSSSSSGGTGTVVTSGGGNPLNLNSDNMSSMTTTNANTTVPMSTHHNHVFTYTPSPLANSITFPSTGTTSSSSGPVFRHMLPQQFRNSIPTGFSFAFPPTGTESPFSSANSMPFPRY